MLRPLTTTVGSTLAALCLVSTLAMAQSPSSMPSQYPTQPEPYQSQPQYPAQPMTPQYGNTTPQQGHRQQPAQSERQYPSQSQSPTQPLPPQYGNATPPQGYGQHPAQSEMRYPSERQTMRMLCIKDNGKGRCVAATGADGRAVVVVGDDLKSGAYMNCVDRGNMVDCDPAS